jgi:hypothetical protein
MSEILHYVEKDGIWDEKERLTSRFFKAVYQNPVNTIGVFSSLALIGYGMHLLSSHIDPTVATPEPELSVQTDDIAPLAPAIPAPEAVIPAEPMPEIAVADTETHLRDFRDNFPESKREFVDLALKLEPITDVDSYVILSKLALETRLSRIQKKRPNISVRAFYNLTS